MMCSGRSGNETYSSCASGLRMSWDSSKASRCRLRSWRRVLKKEWASTVPPLRVSPASRNRTWWLCRIRKHLQYFPGGRPRVGLRACSVTSRRRTVPAFEAPIYCCWARRNRSAMVRVPMYKPGKENATRVELRNPDPACNPYLAFAAMLAAGLRGIEEGYELEDEATNNIYEMTDHERAQAGIDSLPVDLHEAIEEFEGSRLMREALGDHIHEYLIRNKKAEWDAYKAIVTPYELDRYLAVL